jgi:hypothetical protein
MLSPFQLYNKAWLQPVANVFRMKCDFSHLHAVSAGIILFKLTVPVVYQGKVTGGETVR